MLSFTKYTAKFLTEEHMNLVQRLKHNYKQFHDADRVNVIDREYDPESDEDFTPELYQDFLMSDSRTATEEHPYFQFRMRNQPQSHEEVKNGLLFLLRRHGAGDVQTFDVNEEMKHNKLYSHVRYLPGEKTTRFQFRDEQNKPHAATITSIQTFGPHLEHTVSVLPDYRASQKQEIKEEVAERPTVISKIRRLYDHLLAQQDPSQVKSRLKVHSIENHNFHPDSFGVRNAFSPDDHTDAVGTVLDLLQSHGAKNISGPFYARASTPWTDFSHFDFTDGPHQARAHIRTEKFVNSDPTHVYSFEIRA